MGLFSKKPAKDESIDPSFVRATALVITADAPPQGAPSHGSSSHGTIQVLADVPGIGQRHMSATFRYADTRWVVAGMEVPIGVDPARPDAFAVDWASIPTMQQMAEANHPALADPFAASRRIAVAAGITPSAKTAARLERFQQAVASAGSRPAPPGRLRAVAMTVTVRGRYESGGDADGSSSSSGVSLTANSAAVLSVAVAGQPPYPVYLPKFKFPARRLSIPGEPLPVLVSTSDPRDVEILWNEMPGLNDQIAARMSDSMASNNQLHAAMNQHYQATIAQAMASPPQTPPGTHQPTASPTAAAYPGVGMPPQARQMMIENLKRALLYMPDPVQRQMVIDQYRAAGLDITAAELGL